MIALIFRKMHMSVTLLPPLNSELLFQHIGGRRGRHYVFLLIRYLGVRGSDRRNAAFQQWPPTFMGKSVGASGEGGHSKEKPGQSVGTALSDARLSEALSTFRKWF